MATDPRKPFIRPAPLPLPTPPGSQPAASASKDKDKGGGPVLPLWTPSGGDKMAGMPMFRGAGQKSNNLLGRLKSLKTKDVAFIGAGLAVLVMAPLAEFLISEGEDPNGTLTQGFAQNGMPFANGSDPSEIGIMGLARGGVPGDSSDVITPLNARDPSSLIMGGTGEQKEPPAAAPSPEVRRDAPKDNVWDKVVSSAKSGASAATRKVSLPKPGGKLAGAINGLRSLSGGSTGASLKLSAPDSKGLFSSPRNENHLAKTQSAPGYRGAGQRVIAGGSGGNFDGRRGAGGFAGPGGSVAGDVMSGGISGGGRGSGFSGGDGDPTKNPGGNSTKDAKTLGESLAFLRQKMEMEKAIDLKWAKKRYNELERKKMIEQTLVQTAQQAFMKVLDKLLEGKKDGGGSPGGGSPGGGSPGGGSPPGGAQPPTNSAPTPGAGRGGLGAVRSVARAPRAEGVKEQINAAKNVNGDSGKSLGELGSNAGTLSSKAATLAASQDPRLQKLAQPLSDSAKEIDAAVKALKEDLEKAKEPLAKHEETRAALEAKVKELKSAGELGTSASADAAKQPAQLELNGETLTDKGADVSNATQKAQEAKGKAEAAKHEYKPVEPGQEGKGAGEAAANIEKRIAAVEAALTLDPSAKVDPAIQASLTAAKAELAGILRQAAQNVRVAERNVRNAAEATRESSGRVNGTQSGYGAAYDEAKKNIGKVKDGAEALGKVIPKWNGKTTDPGKSGLPAEKEAAATLITSANGEMQKTAQYIADLERRITK